LKMSEDSTRRRIRFGRFKIKSEKHFQQMRVIYYLPDFIEKETEKNPWATWKKHAWAGIERDVSMRQDDYCRFESYPFHRKEMNKITKELTLEYLEKEIDTN